MLGSRAALLRLLYVFLQEKIGREGRGKEIKYTFVIGDWAQHILPAVVTCVHVRCRLGLLSLVRLSKPDGKTRTSKHLLIDCGSMEFGILVTIRFLKYPVFFFISLHPGAEKPSFATKRTLKANVFALCAHDTYS